MLTAHQLMREGVEEQNVCGWYLALHWEPGKVACLKLDLTGREEEMGKEGKVDEKRYNLPSRSLFALLPLYIA